MTRKRLISSKTKQWTNQIYAKLTESHPIHLKSFWSQFIGFPWKLISVVVLIAALVVLVVVVVVFHNIAKWWSFIGDCKSHQIKSNEKSSGLLIILFNVNNAALVWMVSVRPPISNSSSPLNKSMGIFSSAPIIACITVTFMLHRCFS